MTSPSHLTRRVCSLLLALLSCTVAPAFALPPADPPVALGMWEGESKCTVPDSPCHDEHVLYRITADQQDSNRLLIDAYKVVKGEQQFMGTIQCHMPTATTLSCSADTQRKNAWEFQIIGDTMNGTLTVDENKTLYRKISVRRASTNLQGSPDRPHK